MSTYLVGGEGRVGGGDHGEEVVGSEDKVVCSVRRTAVSGKEVDCCGAVVARHGWKRTWMVVGVDSEGGHGVAPMVRGGVALGVVVARRRG